MMTYKGWKPREAQRSRWNKKIAVSRKPGSAAKCPACGQWGRVGEICGCGQIIPTVVQMQLRGWTTNQWANR